MRAIVVNLAEKQLLDTPHHGCEWALKDYNISPEIAELPETEREAIASALASGKESGPTWSLWYDARSKADWPDAFEQARQRCIDSLTFGETHTD